MTYARALEHPASQRGGRSGSCVFSFRSPSGSLAAAKAVNTATKANKTKTSEKLKIQEWLASLVKVIVIPYRVTYRFLFVLLWLQARVFYTCL